VLVTVKLDNNNKKNDFPAFNSYSS